MQKVRKITEEYCLKQIMVCWLVFWMALGLPVQMAMANPAPADNVVPGPGNVIGAPLDWTGTLGLDAVINTAAGNNIIAWNNFDIGQDATLTFTQASGWVLNNVQDISATGIWGGLSGPSCGLIVVNPLGVVFGPQALVTAQGFIASSMSISDTDFLNGLPYTFTGGGVGDILVKEGAQIVTEDMAALIGENIINRGSLSATSGYVIMAAGDSVLITDNPNIVVEVAMTNPADHVVDNGGDLGTGTGTIDAPGGRVILAAGDIFSTAIEGVESLRAEAQRNITFEGEIDATGNVDLLAAQNVQLKDDVTTGGNLTIEATTGAIDATGATIYMTADDKTLSLTQNSSIAMETDFSVSNDEDTDLVATTGGLFTSAAAPNWKSITVTANDDITLNDDLASGTITAGALNSTIGDIDVRSDHGQVLATDDIDAGGSITITGSSGIVASADILAGTGITLNNDVTADGVATDQTFDAGAGKLWAKGTITKLTGSPGNLTLSGDAGVDLDGTVDVDSFSGTLTITDDFTAEGDLLVTGVAVGTEGIIFKGSTVNAEFDGVGDQVINAGMGGLEATGNIVKTTEGMLTIYTIDGVSLTGDASQRIDNKQGRLHVTSTMPGHGTITKDASGAGGLTIGGLKVGSVLGVDLNVNVNVETTGGSLTIEDTFVAAGNLTANNGITFKGDDRVDATMNRSYPIGAPQTIDAGTGVLEATGDIEKTTNGELIIIANGGVSLTGDSSQTMDNMGGRLWVKNAITKTAAGAGHLTLHGVGTQGVDLNGDVDVQTIGSLDSGNLYITDDFIAAGDLRATQDIWLSEAGELDGTTGSGDQRIEAETGVLWAMGTLTKTSSGNLNLAGETHINLDGTVDVRVGSLIIEDNFNAAGDLLASEDVTFSGSVVNGILDRTGNQIIDAEAGSIWANGSLVKTTSGSLTLNAGDDITIGRFGNNRR